MLYRAWIDLLHEFSASEVEFLIVGAHALAVYGHVRATKDMDVWVRASRENGVRVLHALERYGAPLHGLTADDVASGQVVLQLGVAPVRIDILTSVTGVSFDEAWQSRHAVDVENVAVGVLSRQHLIQNKQATGRLQDLADVEWLLRNPDKSGS